MVTLATRIISGKGIVLIDPSNQDWNQARIITVYCTVIRETTSPFKNYNWNPPRSRYATLVFLRNGYVVDEKSMEYGFQAFEYAPETSAQNLYAIECAYAGILQTFYNLGNALALPSISVNDDIKDWVHPNLFWDEIRVVCYAETAIRVVVESLSYDLCPEQTTKEGAPPPPPPANPVPIASGASLNDSDTPYSEPYDGESDNGNSVPHPLDVPPPPPPEFPQGERCVAYRVNYFVNSATGGDASGVQDHWGEIEFVGQDPDNANRLIIISHGQRVTPFSPCYPDPVTTGASSSSSGLNMDTFSYTITPL